METFIVKRDGTREAFSMEKIQRAIAKAFLSVGSFATQDVITNILSRVSVTDGISVEEIQNQVEVALMAERYYTVAKAYMLYRQRHTEDREVRDKLQFLMEYCDASNAATGSKFDANANVENKNMATLIGEARRQPLLHRPNLLPERGFHLAVRRSLRFQVMPQPVILDDRSLGIGGLAVHLRQDDGEVGLEIADAFLDFPHEGRILQRRNDGFYKR